MQKNYSDVCTASYQCNQAMNLFCPSSATSSNCPQALTANKCDCLYTQFYDTALGCGNFFYNVSAIKKIIKLNIVFLSKLKKKQ